MASVAVLVESSDGLSRSVSLADGDSVEIGRLDCGVKRYADARIKKISRCAARLQNAGGVAVVIAVKHELQVMLPNSALVVLSPDQRMAAVNEMRLEVRRSPVSIMLKGQFDLWQRDTDESDSETVASEHGQSQPVPLCMGETQRSEDE